MPEMPDDTKILTALFDFIETVETAIATNNAIAGGLVTDPQAIMDAATINTELLEMWLAGIKLIADESEENKAVRARTAEFMTSGD